MSIGKNGSKGMQETDSPINVFFFSRGKESRKGPSKWTQVAVTNCEMSVEGHDIHRDPIWTGKTGEWRGAGNDTKTSNRLWRKYMLAIHDKDLDPDLVATIKGEACPELIQVGRERSSPEVFEAGFTYSSLTQLWAAYDTDLVDLDLDDEKVIENIQEAYRTEILPPTTIPPAVILAARDEMRKEGQKKASFAPAFQSWKLTRPSKREGSR